MGARYNVYFAGQILAGHEPASVREKLAKVFNANEATLEKLFSGQTQLVKRDCDEATAGRYQAAMAQAGAEAIIKMLGQPDTATDSATAGQSAAEKIAALAAAAETTEPAGASPTQSDAAAQRAPEASSDINLAPSGTEVLREEERAPQITREVDTSALAIDLDTQRLSPEQAAAPDAPDTSHLDMSDVGELIPNLPSDREPLTPDTDGISLAPEGSDMGEQSAPAAAPDLDLSELEIAPAGADVLEEQYRRKEQPEAPPTDHLSLDN